MNQIYDLHCHSTASDGVLSPSEVVQRAYEQQVSVLALTDHDSISGLDEAQAQADRLGMRLINGVEISTQWENRAIHIVGLDFEKTHPKMTALLQQQAEKRLERAVKIGEKLAKIGVENAFEGAKKFTQGEVTRAHYARYLVEIGKVSNINQAFKKYLSQGKSAYVKAEWVDIPNAIEIIHQAGGQAVLAHPLRYTLTTKWIKKLIADFAQSGGDAIEVAGCGQTKDQRLLLARWAVEQGLYGSVGSDFHFPCGWIELGRSLHLPETVLPIWQKFSAVA
ncbi:RNase RNM [Avibacterium paragallinarum]|uniref:Phosphotransferase domain-containing protein n=1 Tax=Avibacterium paragallinarum TaxID=728 RepID=A0A377I7C7_AVIPA|nr:PHP domain-containing protein [Avibacterium paragallinarum]POY47539.1 PHP domain-containing protein [Avibacterium paragallinarum]RZN75304.1 PHP domain-containing protein [Avibacterium paragallinarum]CDF99384.1 Putative S-adenosylmethionine:tRNA ribosyltransferase-isomerase [Avibacterium paragallinarum JF4211]STO71217.1 phosphotransferase domain-containing protein [Avibacterium paragallinarum]